MIQPGSKLAHYEIVSSIGKGGMGEVYRARDTKLGREVAIKTLPEEFAEDPDRLARVEREARLLASLNHPNIAAIHGLEESGPARFLVLELVEGDTLADRLQRGAIPVEDALRLALQIAEALEAAHEKGVIHRDLKPANVKITPDGRIKVLDFGLAKAFTGDQAEMNVSNSPTLSMAATQAGIILGTAAYMSPEQASGEVADHRADVWAFGVVLFEMLTGRQLFTGKTAAHVMGAVLNIDPNWDNLPPSLHPRIRVLLERLLEKESKDRLSSISDARVEIQRVLADPARGALAAAAQSTPLPRRAFQAALVLATILAAGGIGWWVGTGDEPAPPVRRFPLTLASTNELPTDVGTLVALSPDGQTLVYRARDEGTFRLYQRRLDQLDAVPIPGTEGASAYHFFSADGQRLGFVLDGTLMQVSLAGGRPVRISDVPPSRGGSWWEDGTIIVAGNEAGLLRLTAGGGEPEPVIIPEDGRQYWYPQILPGANAVIFTASLQEPDAGDVMLLDLDTRVPRTLIPGGVAGTYVRTGHVVFIRGGDLWAIRFDLEEMDVIGEAAVVEQGIRVEGGGAVQVAVADDGSIAYIPGGSGVYAPRTLVWVDRGGREEAMDMPERTYRYVRQSPAGGSVALEVREEEADIWIWDSSRATLAPLTFGSSGSAPVWHPDGRSVAFACPEGICLQAADGSGTPEVLTDTAFWPRAFSPQGQLLMSQSGPPRDIYLFDDGGSSPEPLIQTSFEETNPEVSPNGQWIAYESNESGRSEIYVRPFPDVVSRRIGPISTAGGTRPLWNPDGTELFYQSGTGTIMSIPIETEPSFSAGRPEIVVQGNYVSPDSGRSYDVSPDGQRFLMLKNADAGFEAPSAQIILVQNWFNELRERLPVD